jgi:MarR family transcriptional regulator, lower aerobic nicotinate degradation pathway regulator
MAPSKQKGRAGGDSKHRTDYQLEAQIGFVLRQASQRHTSIFARAMIDQITPTQWAALVKIKALGTSSQNRLGRETAMDVATIKGVVDRLLARRLIRTSQDPKDSRRVMIRLTEAGSKAVEEGIPIARKITEQTVNLLSTSERAALIKLLRKIS